MTKALELTESDTDLLSDLIRLFREECDSLLEQLESLAKNGDADAIRKAAHRLKGASAAVGAERVTATARTIETLGAAGRIAEMEGLVMELHRMVDEYFRAADQWQKENC